MPIRIHLNCLCAAEEPDECTSSTVGSNSDLAVGTWQPESAVADSSSQWTREDSDHRRQVFMETYITQEQIGTGSTCAVYRVMDLYSQAFALKVMTVRERSMFVNEVSFLTKLKDVRGVIDLHDYLDSDVGCYMVTDLGRVDLFKLVQECGALSEECLRKAMKALLRTLRTMHSNDMVHLDIKPENMVLTTEDPDYPKLIDFGHGMVMSDELTYHVAGGTCYYRSPERAIRKEMAGKYYKAGDMWALGVTCYELLTGRRCFYGRCREVVKAKVLAGQWHWPTTPGFEVSEMCASFISGLLTVDAARRMTAARALKHPWMTGGKSALPHARRAAR